MTCFLSRDLLRVDECILARFKEQERKTLLSSGSFRQDVLIEARESEKLNEKLPELLCECTLKRREQPSIYGSCFDLVTTKYELVSADEAKRK